MMYQLHRPKNDSECDVCPFNSWYRNLCTKSKLYTIINSRLQ